MEPVSVITSDFVNVYVTTPDNTAQCLVTKRFKKDLVVADLKGKLELYTGTQAGSMTVKVFDKEDTLVCTLDNDNALLGSYHVDSGMRLHVEGKSIITKGFEESNVEKFEMSPEEYTKRKDTLKAYLEQNKLGKYNSEQAERREREKKLEEEAEEKCAQNIHAGDRCLVTVTGQPRRKATVMYVGQVKFKPGWWVGVKYDEPLGKNDGSVEGVRYFECFPKYGGFVKPVYIEVGDFPEDEFNLDDEL